MFECLEADLDQPGVLHFQSLENGAGQQIDFVCGDGDFVLLYFFRNGVDGEYGGFLWLALAVESFAEFSQQVASRVVAVAIQRVYHAQQTGANLRQRLIAWYLCAYLLEAVFGLC